MLDSELVRARLFGRPLALLMIQAIGRGEAHVRHVVPHLREALRPVDTLGLYSPTAALVMLPETDQDRALSLARQLTRRGTAEALPPLLAGVAVFPADGTSAEALVTAARAASRRASLSSPVQSASEGAQEEGAQALPGLVIASEKTEALFRLVSKVARADAPVLIRGETGTGKELVARAIHQQSRGLGAPLAAVNCGAIPASLVESTLFGHEKGAFTGAESRRQGFFEAADGGTVFLDEVGELPPEAQSALLRVLETGRLTRVGGVEEVVVDVRVIAATHRDLEELCQKGEFRRDLLYRLDTVTLEVPPLRERPEELEPLALELIQRAAQSCRRRAPALTPEALSVLRAYRWPGNVRELRNVIERALILSDHDELTPEELPLKLRRQTAEEPPDELDEGGERPLDFKDKVRRYEVRLIREALRKTDGNQTEAAALLRMSRRTLVHKLRAYGIRKRY